MPKTRVRFGIAIGGYSPPIDGIRLGSIAESYGFESAWSSDEYILAGVPSPSEQWTNVITMGARSSRMLVGTFVSDCLRIHPSKLAQMAASLDELTYGRAVLGIGAGELVNIVPYGIGWGTPSERVQTVREAIELMKLLWTQGAREEGVNYNGKFFKLKQARMLTHFITKPHPRVYLAAFGGQRLLELVGELADGWLPWQTSPKVWARRLGVVEAAARRVGRDPASIDRVGYLNPYVGQDPKMLAKIRSAIKYNLTIEGYTLRELRAAVSSSKESNVQEIKFSNEDNDLIVRNAALIPDQFLAENDIAAIGTPDEVIDVIEKFVRAGATHLLITDAFRTPSTTSSLLKVFHDKIIPYFRSLT